VDVRPVHCVGSAVPLLLLLPLVWLRTSSCTEPQTPAPSFFPMRQ
jgi:hypothetical protein